MSFAAIDPERNHISKAVRGSSSVGVFPTDIRATRSKGAVELPRPQRWAAAVATLVALQYEYRAWLDSLPENLDTSRLAEKLEAITKLDLDELQTMTHHAATDATEPVAPTQGSANAGTKE